MNSRRFTLPSEPNEPRDGELVSDIPEASRRQLVVMIQDILEDADVPRRFVKQFEHELAFWKSVRGTK